MRAWIVIFFMGAASLQAQTDHSHRMGRALEFPNVPGYLVLKTDLHQHSVFSDGSVWPDIRVMEALLDNLDAISLTEHLEYQPHKKDIPHPDRNRSYELAMQEAKSHQLIVIRGSEITRKMPPGHNNAIFIKDANKLLISDSIDVFKEAVQQGAFVFWNHPQWISQRPDGIATLTPMHQFLIQNQLLHGIEIANEHSYSDEALQIALDNNLTLMGTSDVHQLIDWDYKKTSNGHRPITLVFAKERTEASLKEALMQHKTVVYIKDYLIGKDEWLKPLLTESLRINQATYMGRSSVLEVELENISGNPLILQNMGEFTFHNQADVFTVEAFQKIKLQVKTIERKSNLQMKFTVLNAINKPKSHPSIEKMVTVSK